MKRKPWGGFLLTLVLAVCLSLLPTTARADETHSHAVCGTTCPDEANHGGHGEAVDFQAMYYDTATKELVCGDNKPSGKNREGKYAINSGKYYLNADMTLDAPLLIDALEDVTICLNGHSITVNADESVIAIAGRGKLTLCDCQDGALNPDGSKKEGGKITHGTKPGSSEKYTYTGCGVQVNYNATFTMYGGSVTGNTVSGNGNMGAGVDVGSSTNFAMYGGKVTENTMSGSGGQGAGIRTVGGAIIGGSAEVSKNEVPNGQGAGIYCSNGNLRIQGKAKISENKALDGEGGGVYLANATTRLTISGDAAITGNTAKNGGGVYTDYGTIVLQNQAAITGNTSVTTVADATDGMGGVYMEYSTLEVSGYVQVTGNYRKESETSSERKDSNVYIGNYNISVVGELKDDARIGVTVHETVLDRIKSNKDYSQPIATATTADWIREGSFTHDGGTGNGLYGIRVNDEGTQAELRHDHVWTITVSSARHTFSESCSSCGEAGGSVTLTEPAPNVGEKMVYDGSTVWRPTVTTTGKLHTSVTYSGTYRCVWMDGDRETALGWNDDAAWRNAGHYTVIMEGGGKTDKIQYPVDRRDPAADDFVFTPPALETLEYDGQNKSAAVRWRDGVDGGAIESVYYQKQDDTYVADSNGPVDAGAYRVKISTGFSRNITPLSFFGDTAWTFTIQPADYEYEMPETAELVYGSDTDRLPKGTGTGVALPDGGKETVEGALKWYLDANHSETLEQGDLYNAYSVRDSITLYWVFTATDPNYTTAPETGSVVVTIVEPPKQDLRITTSVSSKDHVAELKKEYGYPEFFLDVQNSPDGGDITYFEFDNEVAKVEKTSGGGLMVTINGAGTTEIKVTAAAVRGKYEATTATCTLKVLPREVIFGAQVKDKIYDGTTDAEVEFTLDRVLPGDEVYVIAADTKFATPDVGKNRMVQISNVTLGGANARGYVVNYGASQQRPLANIREKTIWLERVDRADKEYDGSADYTVRGEVFEGLLPGVTLTRGVDYDISGYFPDADADETDQTVDVFVAYKNNEKTKNYRLDIPNGKYPFPGFARILKQPHGNAAASLDAYYGGSGAADLSGLLVERGTAAVYAVEDDTAILTAYSLGADTVLHAAVVNDRAKIGASATVRVLVTSVNYADYFIDVTVTVSDKENVTISGLTYADKIYDGQAIAPAGTLTVSGDKVPVNELEVRYTGTGGTVYDSASAPTAAGSYQVTYRVPESNADYTGSVTYAFAIRKKAVTVGPKDVTMTAGEALPAFELAHDGLVGGDTLTAVPAPQFTVYALDSDTEVLTPTAGSYRICWTNAGAAAFSGAENYEVSTSAVGTLTVTSSGSSGGGSAAPTYPVNTPDKTEGGTVTVNPKNAKKGETVTITVSPKGGYAPETVTVTDANGNELPLTDLGGGKYSFTMPSGTVSVKATFMEDNSLLNFFYDVPNDAYYYEAVKWAVEKGVTNGIGNNLFGPDQTCTRAQIVTFLYRAAGSPEPTGSASFADVSADSYYAKAVAWAVENGITTGVGGDRFAPDDACTRAQVVTFLARAAKAVSDGQAAFTDIPADAYYASAVAWAADNGVTTGVSGGRFAPDSDCTRAQIVTFLYRLYGTPEG